MKMGGLITVCGLTDIPRVGVLSFEDGASRINHCDSSLSGVLRSDSASAEPDLLS